MATEDTAAHRVIMLRGLCALCGLNYSFIQVKTDLGIASDGT